MHASVKRKRVEGVIRALSWMEPAETKSQIVMSAAKVIRATRGPTSSGRPTWPNSDAVERTVWSYLFNVIDLFHREWLRYAFERSAVKDHAIVLVNNALASHL